MCLICTINGLRWAVQIGNFKKPAFFGANNIFILVIDVQGIAQPTPVAVVPFGWEGRTAQMPTDVAEIIKSDLLRSGRFEPIGEDKMLQKPTDGADVDFQDWSFVGVEAVVVGKVIQTGENAYTLQFQLFDVFGRRQLVGYRMPASRGTMRSQPPMARVVSTRNDAGEPRSAGRCTWACSTAPSG